MTYPEEFLSCSNCPFKISNRSESPKKIQLFEKYSATNKARPLVKLIRHRKTEMISDGNKITSIEIFWELLLSGLPIQ